MKVSELIEYLEQVIERDGNIECAVVDYEGFMTKAEAHVTRVNFHAGVSSDFTDPNEIVLELS